MPNQYIPEINKMEIFIIFVISVGLFALFIEVFGSSKSDSVTLKKSSEVKSIPETKPASAAKINYGDAGFSKKSIPKPKPKPKSKSIELEPESDIDFDDYDFNDGHTDEEWQRVGLKVKGKNYSYSKKYYSFKETEPKCYAEFSGLSPNQRKVKILGGALVSKTGSKRKAKDILVNYYNFEEHTAKYATGYSGYHDW